MLFLKCYLYIITKNKLEIYVQSRIFVGTLINKEMLSKLTVCNQNATIKLKKIKKNKKSDNILLFLSRGKNAI